MIGHPDHQKRECEEGIIQPTTPKGDNTTAYVYDYFIQDYLGNVRAVITEEDATYTDKFLATMEEVYRQIEEDNFDNINETAESLPTGYPLDGSVEFNEKIAALSQANGTEMGPSMVLPVRKGDKVSLSTRYFYTEDAGGETYDNVDLFVNEILMALATSGAGVLKLNEATLIDIASGNSQYANAITDLLSSNFDTSNVSRPHAYLVWMLYDNNMNLIPAGSGVKQVENPNELGTLLRDQIPIIENGYLHAYVSNGSNKAVNFDNFLVTYLRGQTRQINHYYPYGLSISGLGGNYDDYLNKYTSKELQTGEFDPLTSSGLEMFDFHARFYDPQLGRWFVPDPAEQFSNPYLAMGNNPVMYTDPDGRFVQFLIPILIGAGIGGASYTAQAAFSEGGLQQNWDFGAFGKSVGFGAISGAASYGIGQLNMGELNSTMAHGITQGLISEVSGGDFSSGFSSAIFGSFTSSTLIDGGGSFGNSKFGNIALSGLAGGVGSYASGGNFWSGVGVGATVSSLNHLAHIAKRPKFKDLLENFPVGENGEPLPAGQVYESIGGQVASEYNRDPSAYANACALRVSKALNGAGVDIPDMGRQTLTGADGKNYFYRASNLYQWMSRTYGKPNFSTSNYSNLKGNTGVYIMQAHYPAQFGAWGHATLYNMNGTIGNPYNNSYAYRFNLWNFK